MREFSAPAGDAELRVLTDMLGWSFAAKVDEARGWIERAGLENFRVLRSGSEVVGSLMRVDKGQWFGGRSVPMSGIVGVAVPPPHRGRGTAMRLMRAVLEELRHEGIALSALYPATDRLYRKAGYEQAGGRWEITAPLRALQVEDATNGVTVREITEDDHPVIEQLYRQYAQPRNGFLDRVEYNWRRARSRDEIARGFVVAYDGRPEGYIYLSQSMGPTREVAVSVSDMVAVTARATRALMVLLRGHGSLATQVSWFGTPYDAFQNCVVESRDVHVRLKYTWMLRLVDVERALAARGWPPTVRGALHLDVHDDVLPGNCGCYVLEVADGQAAVSRGGRGDLRVDVRGLASVYAGFQPAEVVRSSGRLEADDATCATATSLFAGPTPSMLDFF